VLKKYGFGQILRRQSNAQFDTNSHYFDWKLPPQAPLKIKSKQLTNKLELHLNTENNARGAVKPAGLQGAFWHLWRSDRLRCAKQGRPMARKDEQRRAGELHASPPEQSWGYFCAQRISHFRIVR
jgi:hypothetical protein